MSSSWLRPIIPVLALTASSAVAQSFVGYDDFSGNNAKWSYSFRAPALTVGTNGVLTFNGSVLEFTKGADRGSYLLGWDGDGSAGNASRVAASFTTSWVAEIAATNRHMPESGAFSSVGFEVAIAPNAYTEVTLENSGGVTRVRTETNSATAGVAMATVPTNVDVRLRISWDAAARVLTVSYSVDAGASFTTLRTVPITEWPTLPSAGFFFELMGYSVSAAAIPAGQMQIDNFSVTAVPADYARLGNLSVRNLSAEGDRTLIVGFSISGEGTRPVIARAVSPTLGRLFNVPNLLSDVDVALYSGNTVLTTSAGISTGMSAAFQRVGAFPVDPGTADAALLRSLPSGSYTVHAVPATGSTRREGNTLIEIYEDGRYGTRLSNLSARTELAGEPLIVGFAVTGPQSARVLIRAIGPRLTSFGVSNFVADPRVSVIRMSDSQTIAQNNDWGTATGVVDAATATGAFSLTPGSKDAALVLDLEPGTYSVLVEKSDAATGIVLAEVYQVAP